MAEFGVVDLSAKKILIDDLDKLCAFVNTLQEAELDYQVFIIGDVEVGSSDDYKIAILTPMQTGDGTSWVADFSVYGDAG